jgi:hypothetical protein
LPKSSIFFLLSKKIIYDYDEIAAKNPKSDVQSAMYRSTVLFVAPKAPAGGSIKMALFRGLYIVPGSGSNRMLQNPDDKPHKAPIGLLTEGALWKLYCGSGTCISSIIDASQ